VITFGEVYAAVLHSWRIFRGDRGALQAFDTSFDGFWRSFAVIVALAPLYGVIFLAQQRLVVSDFVRDVEAFPTGGFYVWKIAATLVDWIAFPAVAALLARPLNITSRYALLIVARNWTSILAILPYSFISLLYGLGLLPAAGYVWLAVIVLVVVIRFRYQVYSAALGGPTGLVVGIVALDFLLAIVIGELFDQLIALPA
jgi:hypothetical protein